MEGQTPLSVIGRLSAGETVLTLGVRQARTTDIARMARSAGYGVIWIDLEHSSMPIDTAVQIAATGYITQTKALTLSGNSVLDVILQRVAPAVLLGAPPVPPDGANRSGSGAGCALR